MGSNGERSGSVQVGEGEPLREVSPTLDMQILMMKTQHQFIQNLQRANLALKSKIKQLAEI